MVKIKFCGLKREVDIQWANELHPDYVGFVFAGTKRRVTDDTAQHLRQLLSPDIPAVGVFVDEPAAHIAGLFRQGVIQIAQLHGHEDDDYIRHLQSLADIPLIQAFSVTSPEDLDRARHSLADYILLDNGAGGTGQSFDWSLLTQVGRPYFLAGGLTPENAGQAAALAPYALDVSSGIEEDGVKNKQKMIRFMANARGASPQEGIR
ncbi:phosphoribosylanthranilate isomerase [uncultured Megasphaera sp.]|uniref:phosphoribosylanthranilate isomerase n=1 Tax=uncultured Megasphaera sp. TaxID=165188 RepID=UPI00265AAEE4|nr:phosphoribosylanthranilate isomerase [uncultured Megasphaera sp.]